jgi:site-specific recombinase XerC
MQPVPETLDKIEHEYRQRNELDPDVDLRTVQELAGHKDIQMTTRYAHLALAHKLAAVDWLAEYRKKQ